MHLVVQLVTLYKINTVGAIKQARDHVYSSLVHKQHKVIMHSMGIF